MGTKTLIISALILFVLVSITGMFLLSRQNSNRQINSIIQNTKKTTNNLLASSANSLSHIFTIQKNEPKTQATQAPDSQTQTQNTNQEADNSNLTDSILSNITNQAIKNYNMGNTKLSELDKEQLAKKIIDSRPKINHIFDLQNISNNEIIISQNNSATAQKKYIQQILKILNSNDLNQINELGAINQAVDKKNFQPIRNIVIVYKQIYKQIKEIPVPSLWEETHKKQLACIQSSYNIFDSIANIKSDPLKAMIGFRKYYDIHEASINLSKEIQKKIKQIK